MHNRNSGEELANRVQPEVPPTTTTATITTTTTKVEPDVCLKVQANLIPLCVNNRLQASNVADNRHQCQTTTAVNKDKQRNFYAAVQQPLNDHDEQRAEVDVYLHRGMYRNNIKNFLLY